MWTPETIPSAYVRIDWTDKMERTSRDFGPPERSNGPEVPRRDEIDLLAGWEELQIDPVY